MAVDSKHAAKPEPKAPGVAPGFGLVLLDPSLKPIGLDRGAASMLRRDNEPDTQRELAAIIPKNILDMLRKRKPTDPPSVKMRFRSNDIDYTCQAYQLEQYGSAKQPIMAIYLERASSAADAVNGVATKYKLTERERDVLRGIAQGLANKTLAEQLNISPNTVKIFLRLVMIKVGVTTRSALVAKILRSQETFESGSSSRVEQLAG